MTDRAESNAPSQPSAEVGPCPCGGYGVVYDEEAQRETGVCHESRPADEIEALAKWHDERAEIASLPSGYATGPAQRQHARNHARTAVLLRKLSSDRYPLGKHIDYRGWCEEDGRYYD